MSEIGPICGIPEYFQEPIFPNCMLSIEQEFEESERLVFQEYCDVKVLQDRNASVQLMQYYLDALDLDIHQLKYVHVTGSKGKGTTCFYTESALRKHGLKTGLFVSPHIQNLCERFRINGKSISKETYLEHFRVVWSVLQDIKQRKDRPSYIANWPGFYRFLTLIAFRLFLHEKVDVVILEVGMGGRMDCTNVIEHPLTTGITLVDLEHTEVLGHTLTAIANEKGGIFKAGAPAVAFDQHEEVVTALKSCAAMADCPIRFVKQSDLPATLLSSFPASTPRYLLDNFTVSYFLVSNALQAFQIPLQEAILKTVFQTTHVAARCQRVQQSNTTFLIDGAHTPRSMQAACQWFTACEQDRRKELLFYCGRDKSLSALLTQLVHFDFDKVTFARVKHPKPEYTKILLPTIEELIVEYHCEDAVKDGLLEDVRETMDGKDERECDWLHYVASVWRMEEYKQGLPKRPIQFARDVDDYLEQNSSDKTSQCVCCTGSLYLCGDLLNALGWKEEEELINI